MIQPVNNFLPAYQPQACAQYAQMPYTMQQPQNNAVKIDIINPQAGAAQPPMYNPYAMPMYNQYAMPTASAYAPQAPMQQAQTYCPPIVWADPMVPQQPVQAQTVPQAPITIPPSVINNTSGTQIINAPNPQAYTQTQTVEMPQPPVATVVEPTPVQPAPVQEQVTQDAPVAETVTPAAPQIEPSTTTPGAVDLGLILEKLNSTNLEDQLLAIENIADTANTNPEAATTLLDTQVMDALSNIIKKDTTQMQGPTPEQLELRQKLIAGENLTQEQTAEANKISELEIAERNKQYALYTVAILQKLLATEVEKAQGIKIKTPDLPLINDVANVAKSNPNPMLRASALAALLYIANPENKELLTTMFEQSKNDADPNVQAVAAEALNKLSQI